MGVEAVTEYRFGLGRLIKRKVVSLPPSDEQISVITSETPIPEYVEVIPGGLRLTCITAGHKITNDYLGDQINNMHIQKLPGLVGVSRTMLRWNP